MLDDAAGVAERGHDPWRSRIVGYADIDPAELLANPLNHRTHDRFQREAMAGALDKVGWVGRVKVNRRTGLLVDGHLRVQMARERGEPTVPVAYVDLSEEEEAAILLTFDWLASLATTNQERATQLLESLGDAVPLNLAEVVARLEDLAGTGGAMLDMAGEEKGSHSILPTLSFYDWSIIMTAEESEWLVGLFDDWRERGGDLLALVDTIIGVGQGALGHGVE